MNSDDFEMAASAVMAMAFIGYLLMRLAHARRVVGVSHVKALGTFGEIDVDLVSSPGGRRYASLHYVVTDSDGDEQQVQVLLTSANAKRLAGMLRVAIAPGGTLAHARAAALREARASRAGPTARARP